MKKKNFTWQNSIPMMGLKHYVLAFFLVLALGAGAQNGTWYFGTNGGMSFTNTGTVPLAGSVMNQSEGCASIVDANNNIVMYTNGISIWNGIHVNQGYTLSGAASTTQSTIIVPIPQSGCRAYYIFTVSAAETNYGTTNNRRGLRVSLANVSGVAPNCTVTILAANLDINLLAGTFPTHLMSEKLCAVSDGTGGYWVTTHGVGLYQSYSGGTFNTPINNAAEANFYSVHVTAANNTIPTLAGSLLVNTFATGQHRATQNGGGYYSGQGQMKYNAFGTRIGCAMTSTREVQLYDANPATGVISNQILLPTAFTITGDNLTYGFEFSANGNFAYVSTTFGTNNGVFQLDITSNNPAIISASKTQVGFAPATFGYYYGALQIGPDDQIYVALPTQTSLDVITAPNSLACNYIPNAAAIAGTCNLGLPSVLRNSPCEGNEYHDCSCDASTELWEMSSLDENGVLNIGFFLNSATPAKKIKITLVNYNQLTSPGCALCTPTVVNSYGTITNTPLIGGTPSVLTAATNPGGAAFSRELIWFFATPQVVSQPVNLSFQFPPVNASLGCVNGVEFCLKIEYWDEDCHVCENAIYIVIGGDGADGKIKSPSVDETGSTGAIESKSVEPSADKMHIYPNPAANSITIEIPSITEGTNVKIFDSFGKLVIEQMVTGPTNVINTESLTPGLYSVRYMNGKNQYVSTLMISK
jgi:hypothetical protein